MRQAMASLIVLAFLAIFGANVTMAEEKNVPPNPTVGGEITKIDGQSITLTTTGDKGTKDTVVTVNDQTKVHIETADMVPSGNEGKTKHKVVDGAMSDLKVGQKVSATLNNGTAISITVKFVAPPKPSGEK